MANSFGFNGVDMATYQLVVTRKPAEVSQQVETAQLLDRAYPLGSVRPGKPISLEVAVYHDTPGTLKSNLDSIKAALNHRDDCQFSIDAISGRYWMARFVSMSGSFSSSRLWAGTITFVASDPSAYSTTETDHDHTIDDDPETFEETAGGSERVLPVITLTCDDTLTATTVEINNEETGEILEWTGDLVAADVLVIDCAAYHITLNAIDAMTGLGDGSEFPHLIPGANTIVVSGFSGTCNFTYRARYL